MQPAIEIRNLGKEYKLAAYEPYLSLRDVITRNVKNVLSGKKKIREKFWALKDINLDIMPGERVGVIGRNGAGKSTLLKIISRITPPTTGEAIIRGRVGSLLEVGTGFHPELTGRENIYLNGSILGLKKSEIDKQLDTIIDFSGVERFIDSPLKHYSSGMQMRLAFSVAAHLQSEILLIDEVLAVGDIEFQKKCLGKMEEVSKQDGRTVLFVSHNLKAVNNLCHKAILLQSGELSLFTNTSTVIETYVNTLNQGIHTREIKNSSEKEIYISQIRSCNSELSNRSTFTWDEKIGIGISVTNISWPHSFTIGFGLNSIFKGRILRDQKHFVALAPGETAEYFLWLPEKLFTPGSFSIDLSVLDEKKAVLDFIKDGLQLDITKANSPFEGSEFDSGIFITKLTWQGE